MTDYPSHPELDDELLSAYLDGELPAEEHAAVEARLAADPASRELLHQLRAVSQAVQALPQEVVGRDLGETILRRVEENRRFGGAAPPAMLTAAESPQGSSNGAALRTAPALPTFTIGRTRRGWAWAALAVAAALLIMVFQADPNGNQNLPNVAQRSQPLEEWEQSRQVADGELELRALNKPTESESLAVADLAEHDGAEPAASSTDAPDAQNFRYSAPANQPTPPLDDVAATGRARNFGTQPASGPANAPQAPAAPTTVTLSIEPQTDRDAASLATAADAAPAQGIAVNGAAVDQPVDGLTAAAPAGALGGERQGGAAAEMPALGEPTQPAGDEQLVVVHVLTKRAALQNKTFDQLLATNGIQVAANEAKDAEAAEDTVALNRRELARESEDRFALEPAAQEGRNATVEGEVVLVEAPSATILSCLDSLSRDQENYLGIEVDDTIERELVREAAAATTNDFAAAEVAPEAKKLTEELGLAKFNRGVIPQKQELPSRDKEYYHRFYDLDAQRDGRAVVGGFRGGYGGGGYGGRGGLEQARQQLADLSDERAPQSATNLGRAVRLRSWAIEVPQIRAQQVEEKLTRGETIWADSQRGAAAEKELSALQKELKSPAGSPTDTLHVLFVLQPAVETTPSLPAGNQAK